MPLGVDESAPDPDRTEAASCVAISLWGLLGAIVGPLVAYAGLCATSSVSGQADPIGNIVFPVFAAGCGAPCGGYLAAVGAWAWLALKRRRG